MDYRIMYVLIYRSNCGNNPPAGISLISTPLHPPRTIDAPAAIPHIIALGEPVVSTLNAHDQLPLLPQRIPQRAVIDDLVIDAVEVPETV